MLPFIVVVIVVTSTMLIMSAYLFFQRTIEQDYGNIIRSSASEIDLFMKNAIKDMEAMAYVLRMAGMDAWRTKMVFTAFQINKPQFELIELLTKDGRPLAASGEDTIEGKTLFAGTFNKALSGQSAVSQVIVGNDNLPRIHMAVPVKRMGKIEGILHGTLSLKYVWDVLKGGSIGETGQIFLLDSAGRYIAHREMDHVVRDIVSYGAHTVQAVKASPTPVKWIEKVDGKRYFLIGIYLPGRDWILVLHQALSEIYAYVYASFFWALAITIAAILVAILLVAWRTRHFLYPITTIHRQVKHFSQGDLDHRVTVTVNNEIGDLAEAFNEMAASLKATMEREVQTATELAHAQDLAVLGASASKVTHEVGNLINNMGMLTNALNRECLSENGQLVLTRMEKESARVKDFIRKFLQFAKPPELSIAPTAMDLVIREAVFAQEQAGGRERIAFELDWPEAISKVPVDVRLMYQVFTNLIKNSVEAMDSSGSVRISARVDGTFLEISVQDNGCGIAPEHKPRVFEPFFTTKGKSGTGLGMATVNTIVTAHRGSIQCHSTPGVGTRMAIRLPL